VVTLQEVQRSLEQVYLKVMADTQTPLGVHAEASAAL
jgi:hypothetical protein